MRKRAEKIYRAVNPDDPSEERQREDLELIEAELTDAVAEELRNTILYFQQEMAMLLSGRGQLYLDALKIFDDVLAKLTEEK